MKIDSKDFASWLSRIGAIDPSLAKTVGAFAVPITLLVTSTKFANASKEAQLLFGVLGMSSLVYSVIMVVIFRRDKKNGNKKKL